MAPPSFGDLGKQAKDLFSKAFSAGQCKLEVKTKADSGCKFKSTTVNNTENAITLSTIESEFAWPDYGLKFVEKWNTDNQLSTEVTIEDQLVKGLKASFDSSFNPTSNKKRGIVKTSYKNDYVNGSCDIDFDYAGPVVKGSAVVGYEGWLAGYQMAFDTPKSKLIANNVSLGYDGGDYVLSTSCKDGQDFEGSYYHRYSPQVELAVSSTYSTGSNAANFSAAAKYNLSGDTSLKAKVTKSGQVSLSVQQKVLNGVSLTLSSAVDAMNFQAGGHKVGFAIEVDQ